MDLPVENSLDEVFAQLAPTGPHSRSGLPRRVLFWGEGAGEISSYIAGWMVSQGVDVVVLDGANRFDPYVVSSFGKKTSIPPENLLKRIRIARAFTCYQMATLVEEKLVDLLRQEEASNQTHNPGVILLGPATTFLDEDVPEGEVRSLFERMLRKIEEMAVNGVSFFLFQPATSSEGASPPFRKGRVPGSKRAFLSRKLFQTSDFVWRISWDDEGPKLILEKEFEPNIIENCKLQNEKCKFVGKGLKCLSVGR